MRKLLALACLVMAAGACSDSYRGPEIYRPPAVAQAPVQLSGQQLYQRDCAWCHGRAGSGTERAPDLVTGTGGPADVDFVLSTGRMPVDDPQQTMTRGASLYTRDQIDEIVAYVRTFDAGGPEIPSLDPSRAVLSEGEVLYQENCAACHSTTGIGGALTKGRVVSEPGTYSGRSRVVAPPVTRATPVEIAEAIRVGPGDMPVFGEESIDEVDLDSLVAYVDYLKDPDDRGGAPIGRVGPVAEGAVGWLIGLGIIVLFTRWIGTKRGEP